MKAKTKEIEPPFPVEILDKEPVLVRNKYSGESCMLTPLAVAVYDTIIGAEYLGHYDTMSMGLYWFRVNFPDEYYILLD